MGQLVFQATLGGQVNLVGPNTASTFNLNVPAVSSTIATLTGTETFTNKTLTSPTLTTPVLGTPSSGTLTNCTGLPNAGLTNSSVTVGSTSIALGATATTIAGLTSLATNTLTSASATALTLQSAGTTAITVDTSQNVGIGTASPANKLHVSNGSNSDSGDFTALVVGGTDATNSRTASFIKGTSTPYNFIIRSQNNTGTTSGSMIFQNGVTEQMRIDSSNNLYVGATVTSSTSRFGVRGSGTGSAWEIYAENSTPSQNFGVRDDGNIYAGRLGASTGTALVLNANGYIYTLTSSLRYKKDVEPIDIGLNFILGLNPVKYNLKESDEPQVGFIAEDFPDARLVSMSRIDKEDESKGLQAESVNYAQIVAPLVKAIQELKAINDTQAETINALTARIVALEAK